MRSLPAPRPRRAALATAAALTAAAATVGPAWACTPQPRSFAITPDIAGAGAAASVVGQGFSPKVPVEVRWDGLTGPTIGTAVADERGEFRTPVAIPDALPGMHTVLFVVDDAKPSAIAVGRVPFDVMAPGEPPRTAMAADLWAPGPGVSTRPTGGSHRSLVGVGLLATGLAGVSAGAVMAGRRRATASPPR